ncbi:SPOR domain-containing protein [Sphingomonas sp.]|uniref:SPOR domain-containing protein n=1 Tax=Sphingomonas sp. TaxID=28214 RepID=UPI002FDB5CA9
MPWNARTIILAFVLLAPVDAAHAQDTQRPLEATAPQSQPGEGRYDAVGYATVQPIGAAALAVSASLPPESYAEVTALDSGRTILVRIQSTAETPGFLAALSEGAARQLGAGTGAPIAVRIRAVRPSSEDQAALRSAGAAQLRIDSPPALVRALRLQLPPRPKDEPLPPPPAQSDPIVDVIPHPVFTPTPAKAAAAHGKPVQGRYLVQVAALSSPKRATALAQKLKGFVKAGGGLYRVQLGPFATEAAAERARVEAVRAGFGDARRTSVR